MTIVYNADLLKSVIDSEVLFHKIVDSFEWESTSEGDTYWSVLFDEYSSFSLNAMPIQVRSEVLFKLQNIYIKHLINIPREVKRTKKPDPDEEYLI